MTKGSNIINFFGRTLIVITYTPLLAYLEVGTAALCLSARQEPSLLFQPSLWASFANLRQKYSYCRCGNRTKFSSLLILFLWMRSGYEFHGSVSDATAALFDILYWDSLLPHIFTTVRKNDRRVTTPFFNQDLTGDHLKYFLKCIFICSIQSSLFYTRCLFRSGLQIF